MQRELKNVHPDTGYTGRFRCGTVLAGVFIATACLLGLGCGPDPEITPAAREQAVKKLEPYILERLSDLPHPFAFRLGYAAELADSSVNAATLTVLYKRFYRLHKTLRSSFQSIGDPVPFLLNHAAPGNITLPPPDDPLWQRSVPENPSYMALCMMEGKGIILPNLGDPERVAILADSYRTTPGNIVRAVLHVMTVGPMAVYGENRDLLRSALARARETGHGEFINQVLYPYLWMSLRGEGPGDYTGDKVYRAFNRIFKAEKGEEKYLELFLRAARAYRNGAPLDGVHIQNLNRLFKRHGLRMSYSADIIKFHRITALPVQGTDGKLGDILPARRIGNVLKPGWRGYKQVGEQDVVIALGYIDSDLVQIRKTMAADSGGITYSKHAEILWQLLDVPLSREKASEIHRRLTAREFDGEPDPERARKLIRMIAVHELKHLWDELQFGKDGQLNVDLEFSAHMTDMLLAGSVFHSLSFFLVRMENYFFNADAALQRKMLPYIEDLWKLAIRAAEEDLSRDDLKKELTVLVRRYRMEDGKHIPSPERFRREVLDRNPELIPPYDQLAALLPDDIGGHSNKQ